MCAEGRTTNGKTHMSGHNHFGHRHGYWRVIKCRYCICMGGVNTFVTQEVIHSGLHGGSNPGLRRCFCHVIFGGWRRCSCCCCCCIAAATPIPVPTPGPSFSLIASETGRETGKPSHRQLQLQLQLLIAPNFPDLVWCASLESGLGLVCAPFSSASALALPLVMLEMVTRRMKAARMRASRKTDATSESTKALMLANFGETMPDIVASMISKVGMLGTQSLTVALRGGWA